MAEGTSTLFDSVPQRRRRHTKFAADRMAEERWPGGLALMLEAYRSGRIHIRGISHRIGMKHDTVRKLLLRHGVQLQSASQAHKIAYKNRPELVELSRTRLHAIRSARGEQILRRQHETWLSRAAAMVESKWPGGVAGMIADYRAAKITIRDAERTTGVRYRAIKRILIANGVNPRNTNAAHLVARQLRPDWGRHISETKRQNPFRHTPETTRRATEKRKRLFAEHPERVGNYSVRMSNREVQFSALLDELGIQYVFNQHAGGFWLDFWFPTLQIGIELQRNECIPSKPRDNAIGASLSARAILYIPTRFLADGRFGMVSQFMLALRDHHSELLPILQGCNMLCANRRCGVVQWRGFWFRPKWTDLVGRGRRKASTALSH